MGIMSQWEYTEVCLCADMDVLSLYMDEWD